MKKLIAFILFLASLSAGCIFPTLGVFAMSNADSSMHESMGHDMSSNMGMDDMPSNDSANKHQCCESPFLDSSNPIGFKSSLQDSTDTDNDISVAFASYEKLLENNVHRLNPPPDSEGLFNHAGKNTYISLVGIIKNNS